MKSISEEKSPGKPRAQLTEYNPPCYEHTLLGSLFPGNEEQIEREKPSMHRLVQSRGARCPITVVNDWLSKISLRATYPDGIKNREALIRFCLTRETWMHRRELSRRREHHLTGEDWQLVVDGVSTVGSVSQTEKVDLVAWLDKIAQETLTPNELTVYRLWRDGKSWKEIADAAGVKRQTADSRWRRALQKVRRRVNEIDQSLFSFRL